MVKISRILKFVLPLFLLLAVLVGLGAVYVATLFHRALPDYAGEAKIKGLAARVSIYRDEHGVPHIFASSMNDAARALGYAHASERMFQMEMQRRAGQGRLSEVLGSSMVGTDRFIRTLGLYHLAESSFAALSPEAQSYFEAYADGINAWLETHRDRLPPEFLILGIKPEAWKPADSVVWGKLMGLQLSHNYKLEILRAQVAPSLNGTEMTELFPPPPGLAPITTAPHMLAALPPLPTPAPTSAIPASVPATVPAKTPVPPPAAPPSAAPAVVPSPPSVPSSSPVPPPPAPPPAHPQKNGMRTPFLDDAYAQLGTITGLDHGVSNEWVISGARTESGKPILANDPHLGLEAPILWYLARIVTPELSVKGATVPGLPVVLLGQNDAIAWGFTTTGSDVEDLFKETIDPKNPKNYLTPEGSKPFETHDEIIHVKHGLDVTLHVRSTRHGPVMSDIDEDMAKLAGDGKVMALAFTGLGDKDTSSEALMRLNRAKNWQDFLAALRLYQTPPQNIVYADKDGHIGFYNPGLTPVRKKGDGTMPVDGSSGAYDWVGMIPFPLMPQLYDPPAGYIFNANNAIVGPGSIYFLGVDWEEPYRSERLQEFFDQNKRQSIESSTTMQADHVSLAARELLPYLRALKPESRQAADALALMKAWNGTMDADRPEPLIFEAWLYEMHKHLLVAKTGNDLKERGPYAASSLSLLLSNQDYAWCGTKKNPSMQDCEAVMVEALEDALAMIKSRDGSTVKDWRWGKEHTALLTNKFYSHFPVLSGLSNLSVPSSGDFYTLDRGGSFSFDPDHPFARTHGGGYRGIYDLDDPAKSRFMITTGESGHIMSPHYGDLVPLWNNVKSFTLAGSAKDLGARGLPELTLDPQ